MSDMPSKSAKERILDRLREGQGSAEITDSAETSPIPVVPLQGTKADIRQRFIEEASKIQAKVIPVADEQTAFTELNQIIATDSKIIAWDRSRIPLQGFDQEMLQRGTTIADSNDATQRVGVTGVDAAIAATGSLVLLSGPETPRSPSLLPPVHVAILRESQIVPTLEEWVSQQKDDDYVRFRMASNIIIISGPSRTADIGMELILGAHGPKELFIILLAE